MSIDDEPPQKPNQPKEQQLTPERKLEFAQKGRELAQIAILQSKSYEESIRNVVRAVSYLAEWILYRSIINSPAIPMDGLDLVIMKVASEARFRAEKAVADAVKGDLKAIKQSICGTSEEIFFQRERSTETLRFGSTLRSLSTLLPDTIDVQETPIAYPLPSWKDPEVIKALLDEEDTAREKQEKDEELKDTKDKTGWS